MKLSKLAGRRRSADDLIFDSLNTVFLLLLCLVMLYPMVNTLAVSLNDATDSLRGGIYLLPREFTFFNYKHVFGQSELLQAGLISVLRTVIGTATSVFCTAMVAYTISRQYFVLRRFVTIAFVLTMYLNGGLIPTYLLMRELHLIGTFWIYIIPGLIGVFNLIVVRSFIEGLPETIFESARMDGAGEFTQFFRIALPLCLPVIATVSLFVAVFQWNQWFDVFLYNSSQQHLSTLQYELMKVLQSSNASLTTRSAADAFANAPGQMQEIVTPTSVRAAITIIVSVPIICVYPFLQKYFVKGLTLGGVKG
ncbi:carbohydrate ABC transporter permease [Evansella cellulosilytica]|uniref:Binding-protein-dependent transport systems inner membrane component n=1 Tax=Evansella cellulosilytica (strain ATCC 21833 / DSM 2522 / FERM P-1141 / JCM 9156 / N-4) TaxID=649639 RepID=E6TXL4_EVAC2|nr:carbohydrate ABC transporter permease [Evansella cellulosilytica]ADU28828.1 binding-protein-dependent transport systems inner membrane component [Evansella cellulosilytica DSM 2522]